jgi:hypothetical protein
VNPISNKISYFTANDKEVVVRLVDGCYQITIPKSNYQIIFYKLLLINYFLTGTVEQRAVHQEQTGAAGIKKK